MVKFNKVRSTSNAITNNICQSFAVSHCSGCDTKYDVEIPLQNTDEQDILLAQRTDIVETAISNGNFKTLVTALQAADLVATLKNNRPFTVFAPTDAAFSKLPAQTVSDLLKPENKATLTRILTYHVINGKCLTSAQINAMVIPTRVQMLSGDKVTVCRNGRHLKVNNATVVTADVLATNGVIHVIDTVLLPPANS